MSSKDPSLLLLEHHLKALRLPTVLRDYASGGGRCAARSGAAIRNTCCA